MKRIMLLTLMSVYTTCAASNRVSVVCDVPGSVMLFHEKTPITVTITNQSETQIPFIRDVSHAYDAQIWIDLGNEEPFTHQPPFGLRERKIWPKEITVDKWPEESRLNPGETGMWTLTYSPHMRDIIDYASARGPHRLRYVSNWETTSGRVPKPCRFASLLILQTVPS